jgi:hypothetical protein
MFTQDNASIHTANKVKDWFIEKKIITTTNWARYWPDLDPIEHIWWHVKVRTYEKFPEVAADKSESEHARQRPESCIRAARDTLDQSLIDKFRCEYV